MTAPTIDAARSWRLDLPYDKPPLSLNDRRHHMTVWRIRRALLDAVRQLAIAARIPRLDGIHVDLHYLPARAGTRDQDNVVATLKPCIDGLRDYPERKRKGRMPEPPWIGIVPDDDPAHVTWSRPTIHPPDKAATGPRLWLVITEGINP